MSIFESVLSMLTLIIIGMISIADLGSNTLYHVRLTQMTDYYNADQHGERPGQFIGRGAELLKIQGRVTVDAFRALMQGVHPASGAKLVKNALSNSRAAAWDLCHSAPKSFSVLWALAEPTAQHALESAFMDAVAASVKRIEDATTIRVGSERSHVAANPVISAFVHTSGRAPHDPQFHAHVVGHNVAVTEDGRSGAIVSKPLYQQNLMLGALFRCDLATELTKRFPSMEFRATYVGFEISGVPDEVLSHFSSRSHQIAAELGGLGSETAAAKSFAALSTRSPKQTVPPQNELAKRWREDSQLLGFTQEKVTQLLHRFRQPNVAATPHADQKNSILGRAFNNAIGSLTESNSHFGEHDLVRKVADAATGRAVSGIDVKSYVADRLETSPWLHAVGIHNGQQRYSTSEILVEEQETLQSATLLAGRKTHRVTTPTIAARLSIENWNAVRDWFRLGRHAASETDRSVKHLVGDSGQICVLDGADSSERQAVLKQSAQFWSASGFVLLGAAPSARSTERLESAANIPTVTLRSLIWRADQDASLLAASKHAAKQIVREGAGRYIGLYPWQRKKLLDSKTIVLIDNAEQLSTQDFAALVRHVERSGAKLVLSGDSQRVHSIQRGAPFGRICSDFPKATLTSQAEPFRQIRSGREKELLNDLAKSGRLHVEKTKTDAIERLIADWDRLGGSESPESHLIVANSRAEVAKLNDLASRLMRTRACESAESLILPSGERIFVGDRILCERTSKRFGVPSGSLGTVMGVSRRLNAFQMRLDCGRSVTIPLDVYKHVTRGFAVTTWNTQQANHAYLLLGGKFESKQAAITKITTGTEVHAYADRISAGDDLSQLVRELSTDRQTTLASDISNSRERLERGRAQ